MDRCIHCIHKFHHIFHRGLNRGSTSSTGSSSRSSLGSVSLGVTSHNDLRIVSLQISMSYQDVMSQKLNADMSSLLRLHCFSFQGVPTTAWTGWSSWSRFPSQKRTAKDAMRQNVQNAKLKISMRLRYFP